MRKGKKGKGRRNARENENENNEREQLLQQSQQLPVFPVQNSQYRPPFRLQFPQFQLPPAPPQQFQFQQPAQQFQFQPPAHQFQQPPAHQFQQPPSQFRPQLSVSSFAASPSKLGKYFFYLVNLGLCLSFFFHFYKLVIEGGFTVNQITKYLTMCIFILFLMYLFVNK